MVGQRAAETLERARNHRDFSCWGRRKSRQIFSRGLSGHEIFLIGELRRGRFVGDESQLEVIDDPVHHGIVGEESNDLHRAPALRAEERVDLIHLTDHLCPALGRDGPELLLEYPEGGKPQACLFDLPSMGIGIEAVLC